MVVSLDFLASLPYFAHLPQEAIAEISSYVFARSLAKDEVLFVEGMPAEAIYFVVTGRMKIVKTSIEGKEQVLRIMREGESFNDVPIFDGGPNPATAIAHEPTLVYGIPKAAMEKILEKHPQVASNVIRILASRLRHLVSLVEDLSFRRVMGRVARLLLEQCQDRELHLSQQEMAALAGTVREMVGRSLKSLAAAGAIEVGRRRIIILNPEILKELL